ncbi:MAG: DUF480 domain-containing protein [Acidimicrobiaceae bacterium]|nr:DUF480 domain-containing protein [Acidimicrobiaceae bacterium]
MSRMLTTIQGRVLGCLLEKERTTPDQYPLTLNALVLACNQSTSRDPVMHLVDHEVETVLAGLKSETLLRYVHPSHGRSVTRYRQVADEAWALDPPAAALVAVLLLRGPQTVAELRTRTERMHAFESPEAVETVLRELSLRGSVQLLDRQPGHKEPRWQQLLAEEAEPTSVPAGVAGPPRPAGMVAGASRRQPRRTAERLATLEARVARLEAALGDLLPDETGLLCVNCPLRPAPPPCRSVGDRQPRSGQRRFWRRRWPALPSLRWSARAHCRRHPLYSGPVSFGLVPLAARWRAVQKSVSASSPNAVTAASMRALKRRVLSSSIGNSGAPNTTLLLPAFGRFMPLPKMLPVPSMKTGTTGAPVRLER